MRSKHDVTDCLHYIIDNAARVANYVSGLDQAGFAQNEVLRDAVERCLERICEAAYRLGDQADSLMPGQDWLAIRGMGNRLRHAYDRIDIRIIWNTAVKSVPMLAQAAELALARHSNAQGAG